MSFVIGVPREIFLSEARVALVPDTVKKIIERFKYEVIVESNAGAKAHFTDEAFEKAGAKIVAQAREVYEKSDLIVKIRAPENQEISLMKSHARLISFIWPAQNKDLLEKLSAKKLTVLAMDQVPRISRAQKMDALSSMANIAGYRAVIEAANHFGRFFTGQITAAGKIPPAKVLVIGAGVAGLAAIGTAKSLGAIVRAFDTRPEVKDQIKSMGAEFLELDFKEEGSGQGGYAKQMSKEFIEAEMKLFADQAREVDIIITTALIPGRPAPELILTEHLQLMAEGSVLVDLAAEQGGNCKSTEAGKAVKKHGVTLIGYTDFPSRLPTQASRLYSANIWHFLDEIHLKDAKEFTLDLDNEVIRGSLITLDGEIQWPPPQPVKAPVPAAPAKEVVKPAETKNVMAEHKIHKTNRWTLYFVLLSVLVLFAKFAPSSFLAHFTVFVLACFVGWQVIWNVKAALHTPLMSVTNAISGIIVVGAIVQLNASYLQGSKVGIILSLLAICVASINIVGGFFVTARMLKMFRR